jgi:thiamine kinase-like enzyme
MLCQSGGMTDEDRIRTLPCWTGAITIAPLSGGLSNANYLVTDAKGKHVMRFGVDYPFHHVSRAREVVVSRAAHAAGFSPAVEYAADGAMVTAFVEAHTLSATDVRERPEAVGDLMRRFHADMPSRISGTPVIFWVFHTIRDYIRLLKDQPSPQHQQLDAFAAQARLLEHAQIGMPIVFGHHDLLPANFLDDGKRLWLIDFEYAGFGTAMFDLAGAASHAGMTAEERQAFLFAYFGHKPDAAFMQAFAAMACAALLRETLWAMVSGHFLAAPGVDYAAYTTENLARYEVALGQYQAQYGPLSS